MKHDNAFFLCLLGTLPLGCVLGKYDSDWNKDNGVNLGGGGATVGGSTNPAVGGSNTHLALGGSSSTTTATVTFGGSSVFTSIGGATNAGGTLPTAGGGTSTTQSTGGSGATSTSTAAAGGTSDHQTGGNFNVGGAPPAGGTNAIGGTPSSGGTLASVGGNLATGATPATGGQGAFGGTASSTNTGGASITTGGAVPTTGGVNTGGNPATGGLSNTGGASGGPLLAKAIATGAAHTCALLTDGSVYCWGSNCQGELGDGTQLTACGSEIPADMPKSPTPVRVPGLSAVTTIASGYSHSCAVAQGKVYCWGDGADGQLGNGESGNRYMSSTPVEVLGITNAIALAGGDRFTCALLGDATVSCWGRNEQWELGDGTQTSSPVPVKVVSNANQTVPLGQISGISAGATHACAMQTDGSAWCWGLSSFGQLGQGTNDDAPRAVRTLFSNAAELAAGYVNTCARMSDGSMSCVGCDQKDELGNGAPAKDSSSPVSPNLPLPANVDTIAVGASYTCAVLSSDKSVMCWGVNWAGQLGEGTSDDNAHSPTPVKGLSGVFSISAKYAHSCALVGDGTAYCWGLTHHGQLGYGSTDYITTTPMKVTGF